MMLLGKDLIGNPVISVRDGQILGHVKDLYLDKSLNQLTGLYLGGTGLINQEHHYVERNKITTLGKDTVLIISADAIQESDDPSNGHPWLRRDDLKGRAVDTPGGTKIGSVDDVILTRQGQIAGFSLGRILVDGPISEKGAVARRAIMDTGEVDGQMTVDLPQAEAQQLTVIEPALFAGEKKVTINPDSSDSTDSDPTATPYTEEKPAGTYAAHTAGDKDYKSPYVTKEGKNVDQSKTSPYVSKEEDDEEEEEFKTPYSTPEAEAA